MSDNVGHPEAAGATVLDRSRYLDVPEVSYATRTSYRTIRRGVVKGTFPRPVEWSRKRLLWRREDIEAWMAR